MRPVRFFLAALFVLMLSGGLFAQSGGEQRSVSRGGPSGTASASAQGFNGQVTVTVTISNGIITNVEADGPGETQCIGSRAIADLPASIIAANSADVDSLSGASITSQAIKTAAKEAISAIGN